MRVRCPECDEIFETKMVSSEEKIICQKCKKNLRAPSNQGFVDDGSSVLDLVIYDDIAIDLIETALDIGGNLLESAADCAGDVVDCICDILD